MTRTGTALLVCLGFFSGAARLSAQVLPADRTTVWNPGLNSVGGIPARTTIFKTLSPSGGDDSAAIQAALDACPAGQVVRLSAGTFTVNDYILIHSPITLRGSGPKLTTLQKTNGAVAGEDHHGEDAQPILIVGPQRWPGADDTTSKNLAANGVKGSLSVTVSSGSGFAAGQFVLLDADEYDAASWTALPNRNGVPTSVKIWASDRAVFMRHNPTEDFIDDPFPDSLTWFSRSGRPIAEVKQIASVSGNVVTFTSPLHIDYPTSKAAQLTRFSDTHVQNAGVEDLRTTGASDGSIRFEAAAYCWAKDVEVSTWYGEGVAINSSFRVEVRDSYIHDAAYPSPGGIAYGVSLADGSSEALIENNQILKSNKMMVARCSGAGSVVAYNYADDGLIIYDLTWQEVGLNASHMVGSHHVLFEGNESFNYDSDNTHGNAIYMTVFRNHLTGFRRDYPGLDNGRTAGLNYGSWWHSFVGNVQGVSGAMSGWVYDNSGTGSDPTDPFGGPPSIWKLGYQAGEWEQSADPKVLSTVLRGGNYDYLTNSVHWESISSQPLPKSMYLSGKPAFFGSTPWPPIGPDVAGYVNKIPARACFDQGKMPNCETSGPVPGLQFYPVPPCRLVDTRKPAGPLGGPSLQPSATRTFNIAASTCGIPVTAAVISVNVTVTNPAAPGHVTIDRGDAASLPQTSTINFSASQTRANEALLRVASDGSGTIKVLAATAGTVNLILDVSGYFQ
jgi:hypothetical protein